MSYIEEDRIRENEDALNELSEEELKKFIESFDVYLTNPEDKARKFLITDNLVTFLDYMPKVKYSEYSGFKDLLVEVAGKIDLAKQGTTDVTIMELLNGALDLINNYLKDYTSEKPEYKKYANYPEQKYGKYTYPYYQYDKNKEADKVSKQYGKKLAGYLKMRNTPRFDRDNPVEKELSGVIDNLDTKEDVSDPIDNLFKDALVQIKNKRLELEKRKVELQELSDRKIELVDKKQMLSNYRRTMLDQWIDYEIKRARES